ncbi:MAG: hypothetical protein ACLQUY_04500 [Ktedonobacterales bacterium]
MTDIRDEIVRHAVAIQPVDERWECLRKAERRPEDVLSVEPWSPRLASDRLQPASPGSAWRNALWDDDLCRTCASYSTQDPLDALFFAARGDRFNYGLTCRVEPQLRVMLQEVVRRVQSEDPPQFEVTSALNGNP